MLFGKIQALKICINDGARKAMFNALVQASSAFLEPDFRHVPRYMYKYASPQSPVNHHTLIDNGTKMEIGLTRRHAFPGNEELCEATANTV